MKDFRKLAIVCAIFGAGVFAALPFYRQGRQSDNIVEGSPQDLVLRRRVNLQIGANRTASARGQGVATSQGAAHRPPVIRARPSPEGISGPVSSPAPALSTQFSRLDREGAGQAAGHVRSMAGPSGNRKVGPDVDRGSAGSATARVMVRHRIVDGDSLPDLARRYLGDGELYLTLFDFNRDVLDSPDVLPIGRELKIPYRSEAGQ